MSWSEFAAGTLQAHLGYFGGESGGLNFAETRVRSGTGEGLKPSPGKPSQDFKSCASYSDPCEVRSSLVAHAFRAFHCGRLGVFIENKIKEFRFPIGSIWKVHQESEG